MPPVKPLLDSVPVPLLATAGPFAAETSPESQNTANVVSGHPGLVEYLDEPHAAPALAPMYAPAKVGLSATTTVRSNPSA
jgi:hypothetical protein